MQHVAYYISGHGYGHAVRSSQIISACAQQNPFLFFHIRTTAPEWLFKLSLRSNYFYYSVENDVGTVNPTFDSVDIPATLDSLHHFFENETAFLQNEVDFLHKNNIKLVIGDIPALAFAVAQKAGIPSIAIGNFSWDWIYEPYCKVNPGFEKYVSKFYGYYKNCDLLLKLPFHGKMPAFQNFVEIPLVCRKARRRRKDIRRQIGCRPEEKVVLIALRENDRSGIDLQQLAKMRDKIFIFSGPVQKRPNFRSIDGASFSFEDLINAVDVVVSKPGYGVVSDCIANTTPLLYTDRADFRECEVLITGLRNFTNSAFLEQNEFYKGNWGEALEQLYQTVWPDQQLSIDGDQIAAEKINEFLGRKCGHLSRRKISAASPRNA